MRVVEGAHLKSLVRIIDNVRWRQLVVSAEALLKILKN